MLCKMFCRLAVLGAVVVSASIWGDSAALAQSKKLTTKKPTAREELLKKYDTDGNGKLDSKEIKAMKDAQAKEAAAAAQDTGASLPGAQNPGAGKPGGRPGGLGGPGGFGVPGGPDFEARRAEMMKRFDTNGDGQLDDAERAAMQKQFGQGGPGGFPGKRPGGVNPNNK